MRASGRSLASWLLLLTLATGTALAEPSAEDRATARKLASDAGQALASKDYPKAVDGFRRASTLVPESLLVRVGLAQALEGAGQLVPALEEYRTLVRQGLPSKPTPDETRALKLAEEHIADLEKKIGSLTITVSATTSPPEVSVDGTAVSTASLGVARAVEPGKHRVQAKARGYLATEREVTIAPGGAQSLELRLEVDPKAAAAPTAATTGPLAPSSLPPTEPGPRPGSTQRTIGWTSLAVGGAGLVLGGITGAIALSKQSDLKTNCQPNNTCSGKYVDDNASFKSMVTVSSIGWIVGAVGVGLGATLLLTAPSSKPADAATAARPVDTVRLWLVPGREVSMGGVSGSF